MLEAAPDAVIAIDNTGTIVEFNAGAETVFARSRATAMGVASANCFPTASNSDPWRGPYRGVVLQMSPDCGGSSSGQCVRMAPSFPPMLLARTAASAGPIVTCFIRDLSRWEKA